MSSTALQLHDDGGFYVSAGDVVAGKYLVERVLGSGGMAFVLSARHVELDQHFALKFLDQRFLGNAHIIERFTQEAKAACKIRSEHVARVYDVGTHEGAPFFVMEHLEGRDLLAVVSANGPLRAGDAVEYVMQACEALAVAHCHGIVHRDIKPENLFLVEREGLPIIKVLDFGISKVALTSGEPSSRLTGELTLGTPCYMSPEQIRSTTSADARSDQWSLGVVLYELLAGFEAFRADSVNAVCAAVLECEPQCLAELRPDLPRGLVDVVMRCLEKDPSQRYRDVAELAAALLPFAPTRALVSAERSSSVMRGDRRVNAGEHRISSVRPSSTAAARHHASEVEALKSAAPVARNITSTTAAPVERTGRPLLSAFAAALGVMLAVVVLAYGLRTKHADGGPPAAANAANVAPPAAQELPAAEPARAPTAIRAASGPEPAPPDTAVTVTVTSAQKRAALPAAVPYARPLASTRGAVSASASAPAQAPAVSAAPTAVELGY